MFALIKGTGMLVGIFSTKEHMKVVIEELIKDEYQTSGVHGDYNFRYIEFEINEPWFNDDEYNKEVGKALFSLSTMHTEYFKHCIKTDWSTGQILDMDSDNTTNVNER